MRYLLLFIAFSLVLVLSSHASAKSTYQAFEFDSGGAYHIEGYGAWRLKFDGASHVAISHNVK